MTEKPETTRGIGCPKCGCKHAKVTHTEPQENGTIRRRKVCRNCGRRYRTFETPLPPSQAGNDVERYM